MGLWLRKYVQLWDFEGGATAHCGRSLISAIALLKFVEIL